MVQYTCAGNDIANTSLPSIFFLHNGLPSIKTERRVAEQALIQLFQLLSSLSPSNFWSMSIGAERMFGIWRACFLFSSRRSLLFKAQRNELDLALRIMHLECFSLLQHASLSSQTNEIENNLQPKLAWLVKHLLSKYLRSFATVV
jgi:hypothetical protein